MVDIKFGGCGEKKTLFFSTTINFPMEDWPRPSRLKENPETMMQYNDIIEDQVKKDIIEKIYNNTVEGEIKHYIPLSNHTTVPRN